ncbi:MAG: PspA/IM30 family protein [Solibacillus sp.]|uniref:PspA/IM30 family protein n=1 Tax=unclassified Solibacillus TaxID=2637870 RepID=UPI0031015CD4
MKNLLTKFKYTIQADLHDLFDKKVEKNPIKMLNQYIREAEKQTEETGKLLQRQGQLKKELELQLVETVEMLEKREAQLSLAQGTEDTELIAFAQDEVAAYTARKQALLTSIDAANSEYFSLERKFETMKHKIKDMKVRQLQLMSKENIVRANHQMDKVITANNADNFDELSNYIDELSHNIERKYEVTTFEARLAQLEKEQTFIEQPK